MRLSAQGPLAAAKNGARGNARPDAATTVRHFSRSAKPTVPAWACSAAPYRARQTIIVFDVRMRRTNTATVAGCSSATCARQTSTDPVATEPSTLRSVPASSRAQPYSSRPSRQSRAPALKSLDVECSDRAVFSRCAAPELAIRSGPASSASRS